MICQGLNPVLKNRTPQLALCIILAILSVLIFLYAEDTTCPIKPNRSTAAASSVVNAPQKPDQRWLPFYNRTGRGNNKDLPRILFWTPIYGDWHSGLTEKPADSVFYGNCPYSCYVANDRKALNRSDAVVFYGRDIDLADMPQFRAQGQKWVYWSLEPPPHTSSNSLRYLNNTFNWTQTYGYDSDLVDPYGWVTPQESSAGDSTGLLYEQWKGKTVMAVWPVSNCETFGKREDFMIDLRKYMGVDVYGKCGNFSCPRNGVTNCHEMFQKRYFFYLSFENSICQDYATEKFYKPLQYDMIPVVFGGANYSALAPPGSYINALNFSTPKDLANYLKTVAKNFQLYQSYFRWRGKYKVQLRSGYVFCDLCHKLHGIGFRQSSVYHNFHHWWNTSSHCRAWDQDAQKVYE